MGNSRYFSQDRVAAEEAHSNDENRMALRFNSKTYKFNDIDLELAVRQLPPRDQNILIMHHIAGYTQEEVASVYNLSRSMISKRLRVILDKLAHQLACSQKL